MHFPCVLEPRPSRLLAGLLWLAHGAAGASLFILPWPILLRALLFVALGVSLWRVLPQEFVSLTLQADGQLLCRWAGGQPVAATPAADCAVFPWLIVLRLRCAEEMRWRSVVLLPDSLSADAFRVLRLWLRWRLTTDGRENPAPGP